MELMQDNVAAEVQTDAAQTEQQAQTPQDDYKPEDFYNERDERDQPKPQDATAQQGDDGEGGEDGQQEDGEGEQLDPIEAPLSWQKDYKEKFASLPREMQEIISTREKERETFLQTKSRESAQTRQTVETEARQALQTIMQNHAQQLEPILNQIQPQAPNPALLQSGNPEHMTLYLQQEAAYRAAVAQQDQVSQQLVQARQHAEAIAAQQHQAELQAEHEMLEQVLNTEWSDPSARAKLLSDLQPIAAELGYPPELIAQARGVDILAMKQAHSWKAKADKYDALQKAKMAHVRNAKGIPPTARANAPGAGKAPQDAVALLYPDDVRRN